MSKKLIIIVIIIISLVFFKNLKNASVSHLPIEEKTKLAEEYLMEFKQEAEAFLNELEEITSSPEDLIKKMGEYKKINKRYANKMNNLNLPRPKSSNTKNDPSFHQYLFWANNFQSDERFVMEDFNQRIKQIFVKAGFTQR